MTIRSLAAALVTLLAVPLFAQDMPKPGPEHQKLHAHAGTWDAAIDAMGEQSKGVSVAKVELGGFWLVDHFTADFGGMAFEGRGFTGYDPIKGKYVGTWCDSFSPSMMVLEGSYDAAGKMLTMSGMGVGQDGKPAMHRMVTTLTGANTMTFEMFVTGADGTEAPMMKITYTRRLDKEGKGQKGEKGEKEKGGGQPK
jgi:Protein of unknown function (DUF1579)